MQETNDSKAGRRLWPRLVLLLLGIGLLAFAASTRGDWSRAREVFDSSGRTDTEEWTRAYAKWGIWWGAVANGVICLGLAAIGKWWSSKDPGVELRETKPNPVSKFGWLVLAAALVIGGWMRWDRAALSFYNDEAHTFRRYVAGQWREDKKGDFKYFQVSWLKTMFFNQVGNNSTPCSALARVSYETWSKATHAEPGAVNERAIRFPTIVASLGGIIFLWLLARRLLSNEAAGWVALLSATHFWMVRYGNEGRGYGLTLLSVSAMFYFIHRALEANKWRWWIGVGLAQFLCLWSFTGAIYFVMLLDGLILLSMLWGIRKKRLGKSAFWRPLVGMTIGAMLTIQLMMPTLPQLVAAVDALNSMHGPMGAEWWEDVGAGLAGGLPWREHGEINPEFIGMANPVGMALCGIVGVLGVAGLAFLLASPERRKFSIWLALASLGAIPFSWAMMSSKGLYLHYWYVIYSLPAVMVILAATTSWKPFRWPASALLAATVVLFGNVFYLQRGHTKEDIQSAARLVRDGSPEASNRLVGLFYSDADVYDKHAVLLKSMDALQAMIDQAKASRQELWIIYTRAATMQLEMPEVLARLRNDAEFESIQDFHGNDETLFSQHVVRLRQ